MKENSKNNGDSFKKKDGVVSNNQPTTHRANVGRMDPSPASYYVLYQQKDHCWIRTTTTTEMEPGVKGVLPAACLMVPAAS